MDSKQKAGSDAEEYYKSGKWLCSEAIVAVVNDLLGRPVPQEVVKMASGFPVGIGGAGCTCGALTGGVMALGIKYGRTEPGSENTEILKLSRELHDWFKKTFGSTCCRILIKNVEFGKEEHLKQCTHITGSVADFVVGLILKEKSIDEKL
jgi:C_GCAxxG_C_C family probable redox protein